ncbi:hypothetical protein C2G38_2225152 [Gigaspora rosea]|uniref:Uncharacterized protein n=1 Tax=Gigaspora rosea TaxID=44941 RepID=A0A397TZH0_9GLOM|nr:hypothetical protein C2G38_2225152 [Gigaspora rosea]
MAKYISTADFTINGSLNGLYHFPYDYSDLERRLKELRKSNNNIETEEELAERFTNLFGRQITVETKEVIKDRTYKLPVENVLNDEEIFGDDNENNHHDDIVASDLIQQIKDDVHLENKYAHFGKDSDIELKHKYEKCEKYERSDL